MSDKKSGGGGGEGGGRQETIGGAPTLKRVEEFYDLMDAAQESGPIIPNLDVTPSNVKGVTPFYNFVLKNQGKFPIRPLPKDPYDTTWKIKRDLRESGYVNPARPLPVTDKDLEYLKNKAAAEDYVSFLTWEASKYDLSDPATLQWFHRVCPSYFEQREQLIDDMIDLQAKYAKLRLRGPRNEDDLKLEFLIEKGDITLPETPIWEPLGLYTQPLQPSSTQKDITDNVLAYNKKIYQAGLFSPLVPMSAKISPNSNHQQVMAPNPFNRSDIRGDPTKRFTGISGGLPPINSNYTGYTTEGLGLPARQAAYDQGGSYTQSVQRGWSNITGYGGGARI